MDQKMTGQHFIYIGAIIAIFLQLATFCMALIILPLGIIIGSWLFALFAIFLMGSSIIGIQFALQAWNQNGIFGQKCPKKKVTENNEE